MSDENRMVYRGDETKVHIPDGERVAVGEWLAGMLNKGMRVRAYQAGGANARAYTSPLCPGCYMVAGFNMMVTLAKQNGQSLKELGRSMACAFDALAQGGPDAIEQIRVVLDSDGDACQIVSKGNG